MTTRISLFLFFSLLPLFTASAQEEEPIEVFSEKSYVPPSGDKRDYMSLAIYWWPNPSTKIPYFRRDGIRNPEADDYDSPRLQKLIRQVSSLAKKYEETQEISHAQDAVTRIRQWFLDPDHRMNPNLDYAQFIPGIRNGSYHGIVETNHLASRFLDSLPALIKSGALTEQDLAGLRAWFADFLHWLENSPNGKEEDRQDSNHGLWYDFQRVRYAQFIGKNEHADKILSEVGHRRIARQIRPDGSMPAEMKRTKSYSYVCYALGPLLDLAELGLPRGIDIYSYQSDTGGSLRAALLYTLNHVADPATWPGKELAPIDPKRIIQLTQRYLAVKPDPELQAAVDKLESQNSSSKK